MTKVLPIRAAVLVTGQAGKVQSDGDTGTGRRRHDEHGPGQKRGE